MTNYLNKLHYKWYRIDSDVDRIAILSLENCKASFIQNERGNKEKHVNLITVYVTLYLELYITWIENVFEAHQRKECKKKLRINFHVAVTRESLLPRST